MASHFSAIWVTDATRVMLSEAKHLSADLAPSIAQTPKRQEYVQLGERPFATLRVTDSKQIAQS